MEISIPRADVSSSNWMTSEDSQYLIPVGTHWRIALRPHVWRPSTDVYETDQAIIVRVEIAGMREEDFNISIEDRSLSIRGVRPDLAERRAFHQMEIPFGEFGVELDLPVPILHDQIEAVYRDGFLQIVLPKARPHSVRVEA